MVNCSKLGESTRKSMYSVGGQKDWELITPQLPSRFMLSRLHSQSGFPLKCVQMELSDDEVI